MGAVAAPSAKAALASPRCSETPFTIAGIAEFQASENDFYFCTEFTRRSIDRFIGGNDCGDFLFGSGKLEGGLVMLDAQSAIFEY